MKGRLPKRGTLIHVEWDDAAGNSTWSNSGRMSLVQCESVGYLTHKAKNRIVLASNHSNAGSTWGSRQTIPRSTIRVVRRVRVRKP